LEAAGAESGQRYICAIKGACAGGGEELGGLRGLRFHMQRSAIQGSPAVFDRLSVDASEAYL